VRMSKKLPPRDSLGRFCRKPTPTLIDPKILRELGVHRRPFELVSDHEIVVTIYHPKLAPNPDE
jgi:hypothetical protein